jgi:PleD family two-component response regulator
VGREEFALVLRDASQAHEVAEAIRRAVPLGQTCSIGFARHQPAESLGDLMRRADAALYRAKTGGRNRVVAA